MKIILTILFVSLVILLLVFLLNITTYNGTTNHNKLPENSNKNEKNS